MRLAIKPFLSFNRRYTPLCLSVRRSVDQIPNALVTSNTGPALLHATGIAVYPALFFLRSVKYVYDRSINVFESAMANYFSISE